MFWNFAKHVFNKPKCLVNENMSHAFLQQIYCLSTKHVQSDINLKKGEGRGGGDMVFSLTNILIEKTIFC